MIDWFKFDHDARDDIEIKELEFDLGPEGFGIFMFLVLALANSDNGKLPTKFVFSDIYRYSKSPQTKAKVEKINRVLRNYGLFKFETDEKGNEIFYSTRMLTNMEKVDKKSEDCSKAAKAKAEKEKAEKEKKNCGCSADALPSKDIDIDKELNNNISIDSSSKETPKVEEISQEELDFKIFWNAYPKKEGKKEAEKAYKKARKHVKAEILLEALEDHKKKKFSKTTYEYIPHASTWLNQERWNDVISENSQKTEFNDSLDSLDLLDNNPLMPGYQPNISSLPIATM